MALQSLNELKFRHQAPKNTNQVLHITYPVKPNEVVRNLFWSTDPSSIEMVSTDPKNV
jgi:hypothetical protein